MSLKKKLVLMSCLTIISLVFLNPILTQAKTTRTEFYSIEYNSFAGTPERQWVEDGILHIRNQLYIFQVVEGDIKGTVIFLSSMNVDLATGEGTGWGTNTFEEERIAEGPYKGLAIAWTGISVSKVSEFGTPTMKLYGKFVAHGYADFNGMHIKGYYERRGPPLGGTILAGEVLNPHG